MCSDSMWLQDYNYYNYYNVLSYHDHIPIPVDAGSGNFFPMHSSTPTISDRMYNPVSDMSQTQEMNNTTTDNITNPCSFNPVSIADYTEY